MNPLRVLIDAGFTLRADGERLIVTPASALTDSLRELIRQNKADLLTLLARAVERSRASTTTAASASTGEDTGSAPPVVDADRCCWPRSDAMNYVELETFAMRMGQFIRRGIEGDDASALADQLVKRDRDGDDRRLCLECSWLGDMGRCIAAASGWLPDADRRLEPVITILQWCPAFGLRKGLR